jgi:hypothetical protein
MFRNKEAKNICFFHYYQDYFKDTKIVFYNPYIYSTNIKYWSMFNLNFFI